MRKRPLLLVAILAGLLGGCNGDSESSTAETPQAYATPSVTPEAVSAAETLTPVPTVSGTLPASVSCELDPFDFPVASGIPPVTDADHAHGPADAPVTIIEYADFQ